MILLHFVIFYFIGFYLPFSAFFSFPCPFFFDILSLLFSSFVVGLLLSNNSSRLPHVQPPIISLKSRILMIVTLPYYISLYGTLPHFIYFYFITLLCQELNTDTGRYVVHKLWPRYGTIAKSSYFNYSGSTVHDRDLIYNISSLKQSKYRPFQYALLLLYFILFCSTLFDTSLFYSALLQRRKGREEKEAIDLRKVKERKERSGRGREEEGKKGGKKGEKAGKYRIECDNSYFSEKFVLFQYNKFLMFSSNFKAQ